MRYCAGEAPILTLSGRVALHAQVDEAIVVRAASCLGLRLLLLLTHWLLGSALEPAKAAIIHVGLLREAAA